MLGAIITGAIAGLLGTIPLAVGLRGLGRTPQKNTKARNALYAYAPYWGLAVSVVVTFGLAALCVVFARDAAMVFVLAEAIALSAATIAYGFVVVKHR